MQPAERRRGPSVRGGEDLFDLAGLRPGGDPGETRRYYRIAGVTLQVESDLPFTGATFDRKFEPFRVDGPGDDTVVLHHHFGVPGVDVAALGPAVYRRPPWAIHHTSWGWAYLGIPPSMGDGEVERVIAFDEAHAVGRFFNGPDELAMFRRGGLAALTLMPTDQIMLARLLADRRACFLHSCGIVLDGHGLLFVGESGAGKSTAMSQFAGLAEPLCDDRNIVRLWGDEVRVHGTWSHGTVPIVSSGSAPLRAVFFLRKAAHNAAEPVSDPAVAVRALLPRLIRPLATPDWWSRMFDLLEVIVRRVPCYELSFDRSGDMVPVVRELLAGGAPAPSVS